MDSRRWWCLLPKNYNILNLGNSFIVKNIGFIHNMLPPPYCVTGPRWVNLNPRNRIQWNIKRILIQENAFENVVCEMAAIFIDLNVQRKNLLTRPCFFYRTFACHYALFVDERYPLILNNTLKANHFQCFNVPWFQQFTTNVLCYIYNFTEKIHSHGCLWFIIILRALRIAQYFDHVLDTCYYWFCSVITFRLNIIIINAKHQYNYSRSLPKFPLKTATIFKAFCSCVDFNSGWLKLTRIKVALDDFQEGTLYLPAWTAMYIRETPMSRDTSPASPFISTSSGYWLTVTFVFVRCNYPSMPKLQRRVSNHCLV